MPPPPPPSGQSSAPEQPVASSSTASPERPRGRKRTRGPAQPAAPAHTLVVNRNRNQARSPTPPARIIKSTYGGNLFTVEDILYLKKYIDYCQDQGLVLSLREICERIAVKVWPGLSFVQISPTDFVLHLGSTMNLVNVEINFLLVYAMMLLPAFPWVMRILHK